jgi:hypothetical protein
MARYVASVESPWEREAAFDYLADFANIADWDPGVARARPLSDEALAVGARFEVVSSFLGREIPLVYETIEIDRPRRVLLRAESGTVVSLDEMSFDLRPGGGTIVTYDARLTAKGAFRPFAPLLGLMLRRLGDAARDGLRERIATTGPGGQPR